MILEAATELLESTRIIIAHSREAEVGRERAEEQSDRMREYFESRMVGEQATMPNMAYFESTQAMVQSVYDRERAFLRSFHALMVLWSAEDVRDLVEDAFRALEEIRLLDAEPIIAPTADLGEADGDHLDLRRMRSLMSAMGDRLKGQRQRWNDLSAHEEKLLERVHQDAVAIFTKLQSVN